MFVARFDDAKTWQALISAISALVDEANFEVTPKGITLRAMDPSRIAMVDFELPKSAFSHFKADEEGRIGINLDEMEKIVKRAGAGNSLEISVEPDKNQLQLKLEGRTKRSFRISLIELGAERPPALTVDFDVSIKITADTLKELIVKNVTGDLRHIPDHSIIPNLRHENALKKCLDAVHRVLFGLQDNRPVELIAIDIKEAIEWLDTIVGTKPSADVLDQIFNQFCIGK